MKLPFSQMHLRFSWFENYFFTEIQPKLPNNNPDYVLDVLTELGWDVDYELFPSDDDKYQYNVSSMAEKDLEKLEAIGYDRRTGKLKNPKEFKPILIFHNINPDSPQMTLLAMKY